MDVAAHTVSGFCSPKGEGSGNPTKERPIVLEGLAIEDGSECVARNFGVHLLGRSSSVKMVKTRGRDTCDFIGFARDESSMMSP